MGTSTYSNLMAQGYEPQQPLLARKTVVTQEKGVKYTLDVKSQQPSVIFQVDGNIIKNGRKCDKLVMVKTKSEISEQWAQIYVELKGHDAVHGIEQLLATANNPIFAHPSNKVRKARLVATSIPSNKSNPMVAKLKREFAKIGIEYKSLKPGQRDNI